MAYTLTYYPYNPNHNRTKLSKRSMFISLMSVKKKLMVQFKLSIRGVKNALCRSSGMSICWDATINMGLFLLVINSKAEHNIYYCCNLFPYKTHFKYIYINKIRRYLNKSFHQGDNILQLQYQWIVNHKHNNARSKSLVKKLTSIMSDCERCFVPV